MRQSIFENNSHEIALGMEKFSNLVSLLSGEDYIFRIRIYLRNFAFIAEEF